LGWPEEILKDRAKEFAAEVSRARTELDKELEKIRAELDVLHRAETYEPSIDGKLQCYECWVQRGQKSDLVQTEKNEKEHVDVYRCLGCKESFHLRWQ
jgi:Pyruvate/2-oxoacid:ferredoxin oxidoreductase delta subunit